MSEQQPRRPLRPRLTRGQCIYFSAVVCAQTAAIVCLIAAFVVGVSSEKGQLLLSISTPISHFCTAAVLFCIAWLLQQRNTQVSPDNEER